MVNDLPGFKVLLTAGKGLTPAQQAWPPITLEAFAQVEMKRAQRRTLGEMRSIQWTDHANVKRMQTAEEIDLKHLRWISDIITDGTLLKVLSGRVMLLGDGDSRTPKDRDLLIQQRSKDLEGVAGQTRVFDLDEFLSGWEARDGKPIPWTCPADSGPPPAAKIKRGSCATVLEPEEE